jgi:hypothetical protein
MSREDPPDVAVLNEPNGVKIVVSKPGAVHGATGSGGTASEFHVSDDGPLMRFLTTRHV